MRFHVAACDHTTAETMLRELLGFLMSADDSGEGKGIVKETGNKGEANLEIEDLVPARVAKKPFWSRGGDMISYSLNTVRLSSLKFKDYKSVRSSQVVRFQMNQDETKRILTVSLFVYICMQPQFFRHARNEYTKSKFVGMQGQRD